MAQARIDIPASRYHGRQQIHAKVHNFGSLPVTICVEFGQTSLKADGEREITPSPFWVQRNDGGKWGTLMIGPDVGGMQAAVLVHANESKEFSIRLMDSGRIRLRLRYWSRAIPNLDCYVPPKGSKRATSVVFTVD